MIINPINVSNLLTVTFFSDEKKLRHLYLNLQAILKSQFPAKNSLISNKKIKDRVFVKR